jgi:hypothetical protein
MIVIAAKARINRTAAQPVQGRRDRQNHMLNQMLAAR